MKTISLPGMHTAASAAAAAALHIQRDGPNLWWVALAGGPASRAPSVEPSALPSAVLRAHADPTAMTLVKVELDACGAWVTLANAERCRPVVVRHAGWVDVRGHPYDRPTALTDDRVGLGPGDSLVLARTETTDDSFLDCLLSAQPEVDDLRAAAVAACGSPDAVVAVVGVPDELGDEPRQRVLDATGIADDELVLPGYPLGDLQPELWAEPPRPPRMARLRLRPDYTSVRDVRNLLDRLLASWRLTSRIDEEGLKLAASELASNAVLHTREPESATVRMFDQGVRVEVDDASDEAPLMREATTDDFDGRGLRVVDAVSSSWGVEARPRGKRVWCEIRLTD